MLSDDQCTAKRNHHENSEQTTQDGYQDDARKFEVEAEDQNRRHRHTDTESDRLTRRSGSLDDVMLEYRRVAQAQFGEDPENSYRNHGYRNGRANGKPDF